MIIIVANGKQYSVKVGNGYCQFGWLFAAIAFQLLLILLQYLQQNKLSLPKKPVVVAEKASYRNDIAGQWPVVVPEKKLSKPAAMADR